MAGQYLAAGLTALVFLGRLAAHLYDWWLYSKCTGRRG
ncbi:hypothetical protein F4559_006426 [Saccharothrix violaceirubra]|uniref:Uncharacterized protein n=1 Tax=Saccharothrix violaceirubra TaxID=413306 RepID=A0A7W7T9J5_9PSEU|nr:hypothetical protein [Saccharothrix violaceirubra]